MKTNNLLKVVIFAFAIAFTACVQDDDFNTPSDLGEAENTRLTTLLNDTSFTEVSIDYVKGLFVDGEVHHITSDIYVKGYVVSSDEQGNFYKEFYIQNEPANPTAAIKVVLNVSDAFAKYNFGREVYINLKDLHVGETNSGDGVIAIGGGADADGDELEEVTEARANLQVLRSETTAVVTGLPVTFSAIGDTHIGMYVTVNDMQFPTNLAGNSPFVSPFDDFDSQRTMESCEGFGYANFILETSTFASFKDAMIPAGGGMISGVISKDYNGDNTVMVLNSVEDVMLNNTRCTPLDLADFTTTLLDEDFESMTNNADVSGNGWTNFATAGGNLWEVETTNDSGNSGSKIASIGAYNSNDNSNIAWLISPAIDLDAQGVEILTFQTSNSFSDGSELEVLISNDWDGNTANIATATWNTVPVGVVQDGEYYQNWVDSNVELTSFSGTSYIAFKYVGGDDGTNIDGTYELDNVKVLAQ